ncbi:MAG: T9SS type A sorting domain-containing protein, partial [Bacteroidales bacterium]|nr:T9SS type A sorting domain-containing protein [Bacteroidales bacterium]
DINSALMDKEDVLIYPNPTEGQITVTWKNRYSHRLNITIYNIVGQIVKEIQTDPDVNEIRLDLDGTSRGIYLFEMRDKKNNVMLNRSRIIKR